MTQGTSVLMLEDEPIVAFALEDMLHDLGFADVRLATTLAEAFGHLESGSPDMAVLDVNIRGQRSYGLADKLIGLGVPLIFATGYGDAGHPEALKRVPTVAKPYSPADLRSALEVAAERG